MMETKSSCSDESDSLKKYFKDVKKSVILTQEEEINLAEKIRSGDTVAADKLVKANLKFVVSIAKEYQGQGLPLSDLISEGNYGLVKAATRFDHRKGFRFISYAVWWIRQSIMHSLNESSRTIRLPSSLVQKNIALSKKRGLTNNRNKLSEVVETFVSIDKIIPDSATYQQKISLNEPINYDGDEMIDLFACGTSDIFVCENDYEKSEKNTIDERIKNELMSLLDILDVREKAIIQAYFGLGEENESLTLESIGLTYGLTKERIRQIKEQAIRKLRYNSSDLLKVLNEI